MLIECRKIDRLSQFLKNYDYEFKYFSLITMVAKGQSYLARRAKINNVNMPNYPTPIKLSTPKFLKKKKTVEIIFY